LFWFTSGIVGGARLPLIVLLILFHFQTELDALIVIAEDPTD
jgi:hypothetical protein